MVVAISGGRDRRSGSPRRAARTVWTFPAVLRRRLHPAVGLIAGAPPAGLTLARRRGVPILARTRLISVPAGPLSVPGAPHVVPAPIVVGGEANHGDAERGEAHVGQKHVVAAPLKGEVFADHPAAVAGPDHVTPGLVSEAAPDLEGRAFGNEIDSREVDIRAGAHVDVGGRITGRCVRGGRPHQCSAEDGAHQFQFSHRNPQCGWCAVGGPEHCPHMHNGTNARNPALVCLQMPQGLWREMALKAALSGRVRARR